MRADVMNETSKEFWMFFYFLKAAIFTRCFEKLFLQVVPTSAQSSVLKIFYG